MVPKKHAEEHFLNTHAPVRWFFYFSPVFKLFSVWIISKTKTIIFDLKNFSLLAP